MSYLDLPFWKQFLLTCEDHLLGELTLFLWLCSLFPSPAAKPFLKKLPPVFFLAPVTAAFNWIAAGIIKNTPLMWLVYLLITSFFTLWSMWVWRRPFWHCLAAVCISGMMEISFSVIFSHLLESCILLTAPKYASPVFLTHLLWLTLPLHPALSLLLKRLWAEEGACMIPEHPVHIRRTALLLAALETAFVILSHMQYGIEPRYLAEYLAVTAVMAVLATTLLFHLSLRDMDQRRLLLQEDMLTRQQLYEQSLEELQQELRTFRHDCRNLLAGLAGSSENGALSRSFSELEAGFEKRLGEKLRTAAQIGNLRIPQVRSLLLGKLTQMAENGILCRLEVLYPVAYVAMDLWDLIRCLGILIDNAAEAALETEQPWVELLFLQEACTLTFQVSNPWSRAADPENFWSEGWSSKGQGRGMGLFSYQKILRKYPNASAATRWSDGIFIQELTIEELGGKP